MMANKSRTVTALCVGICMGATLHALFFPNAQNALAQTSKPAQDLQSLSAEIETIKGMLPDQAHAMQDVGYHFSNLWFAVQKENWTLATFYLNETRSHLRWAVKLKPKRKDSAGYEIDLQKLLEAFENSPWKQMEGAIAAKDKTDFERKYRWFGLDTCYSCHKASEKPFLKPQIPTQPETPIINFDPKADWPK
jgi:hypothetical protein